MLRYAWLVLLGVALAASTAGAQSESVRMWAANAAPNFPSAFPPQPAPAPMPIDPPSLDLFPVFPMQARIGYTFVKFFEQPADKPSLNGLSYGYTWYVQRPIGIDGEMNSIWGMDQVKLNCNCGKFLFVGGGPRLRRPTDAHWEPWVHALFGYTQYAIQRANSSQGSFGVEFGGGLDYRFTRWFSPRIEVDGITSTMYQTHEISPKIGVSAVFNY